MQFLFVYIVLQHYLQSQVSDTMSYPLRTSINCPIIAYVCASPEYRLAICGHRLCGTLCQYYVRLFTWIQVSLIVRTEPKSESG